MKRVKPIPTRRAAVEDIVARMYAGTPYGDRLRKMGVPIEEREIVMAMAEAEFVSPVHSILPTGCKLKEWR